MANIVVVGPHPDDQEIGMGGTIAMLAAQGHDVLLLDITDGSPTPQGDRASRLIEAEEARKALCPPQELIAAGRAKPVRRLLLDLPNRMVEHTVANRHKVAGVYRAHQAQIIFVPHPEDAHPDHLAVTKIASDARFDAKLTKIEMPVPPGHTTIGPPIYPRWLFHYYCSHLRRPADPTFIMDVSAFMEQKRRSIEAYRTQFGMNPINAGFPDKLLAFNGYFGWLIGTAFGEPFTSKEPMGLTGFGALPL
jgi:LmbE family N-acetylglucosaminyl deacetylase